MSTSENEKNDGGEETHEGDKGETKQEGEGEEEARQGEEGGESLEGEGGKEQEGEGGEEQEDPLISLLVPELECPVCLSTMVGSATTSELKRMPKLHTRPHQKIAHVVPQSALKLADSTPLLPALSPSPSPGGKEGPSAVQERPLLL